MLEERSSCAMLRLELTLAIISPCVTMLAVVVSRVLTRELCTSESSVLSSSRRREIREDTFSASSVLVTMIICDEKVSVIHEYD